MSAQIRFCAIPAGTVSASGLSIQNISSAQSSIDHLTTIKVACLSAAADQVGFLGKLGMLADVPFSADAADILALSVDG